MAGVQTAPLVAGEVEEGPAPVQPPARPSAALVKTYRARATSSQSGPTHIRSGHVQH